MKENWFNKSIEQTEKELETNIKNGLNKEQVEKAREKYGLNELKAKKKKSLIIKFLEPIKCNEDIKEETEKLMNIIKKERGKE